MESRAAILGHPLHPMLIVFPIGLLTTAFLFDIIYVITRDHFWRRSAFWLVLLGELGAIVAAIPGLVDYLLISMPATTRDVASDHLMLGVVVILLYAVQLLARRRYAAAQAGAPGYPAWLMVLALVSVGALSAQGAIGGDLAHIRGVGVICPPAARPSPAATRAVTHPTTTADVEGRKVFVANCARCHGTNAEGKIGPRLVNNDLTLGEIRGRVMNGKPLMMPAFSGKLPPGQISAVVAYVASMSARK